MNSFSWFDFVRVDNTRRTRRASSTDPTGGNRDRLSIVRGETHTLLDVKGPGCITHIWFTPASIEDDYLRKLVLRIYWDGESEPSVNVPVGDFFGIGHAEATTYTSLPMVEAPRNGMGLNCYLPMPFNQSARVEVTSENFGSEIRLYYNIDYELWDTLPEGLGRFHAQWRRQNPTDGMVEKPDTPDYVMTHHGKNLDGEGNYLILDAEGAGQFIGCNLNIHNLRVAKDHGNWYGEGDEMIWVDDDTAPKHWPPTIHGTGTEDYFNTAWGPNEKYSSPFFGLTKPGGYEFSGKISWYRWHLLDPVRFSRAIRVTIEHGHANRLSNDYSSTAYWYQTEPHKPFELLPVEERLPRADFPELKEPEEKK